MPDEKEKKKWTLVRAGHESDPLELDTELLAVFRCLKTPEALPFYLRCLRVRVEDAEDDLIEGVIALGQPALAPLLKLYEELGEESCWSSCHHVLWRGLRV